MRSTLAMLTCLLFSTTLLGCQSTPAELPQSAKLTFAADRYPAVFEAAVEVLRDNGYRIARRDYRFGTITTFPKEAATLAEFWIDDATTRAQKRDDTLNSQQRTVTVTVEQPEGEEAYSLRVEVLVQRLQRPERYLTHSAGDRITASYTDVPTHLSNRGIDGPYAQRLDRDPLLERRLLEAIRNATVLNANEIPAADQEAARIKRKLELAESLLELATHDPLTTSQRQNSPELVTLDRFQRGQAFNKLADLVDRLAKDHLDDNAVVDLQTRTQDALADFERIEANN